MAWSNRTSRGELLSPAEVQWSTTKSGGVWGHRVSAEPEERRMAEGDHPRVAGEHIPRNPQHRPDRDQRQHKLVVLVLDQHRRGEIDDRDHKDDPDVAADGSFHGYTRSALRPNKPSGRTKTISRKTTKIAAFCNCTGRTSVESCCTRPMVRPPQNAPTMLPNPPSTTPAYMMITNSSPTSG